MKSEEPMSFSRISKRGAAVAAAAALFLAGCGGDNGDTGAQPDPDNPVAVTAGTLLAADYAPLFVADQEGYFEEEGLDVTIETIAGGAVGVKIGRASGRG